MKFENSYIELGERINTPPIYKTSLPSHASSPELLLWNQPLAKALNILMTKADNAAEIASIFSGTHILESSTPIALAYAGHQFGHFNPQLGDGRAHLLGELYSTDNTRVDIQLKGSGRTPYSRSGDGLCGLGAAIREYIMSEAMFALGVPTCRTLAVVASGDLVQRETMVPGAIVTRVADSHLRVGTFEYFYAQGELEAVEALCTYAIERHYSHLQSLTGEERYLAFLQAVFEKQITLMVEWMRVGFIHGVMNTDNTAISGQTIDFGPCAMLGVYNPNTVYSSIDSMGRYRFGYQPNIARWNMARLTECILPLLGGDESIAQEKGEALLKQFADNFKQRYFKMLCAKIGLDGSGEGDNILASDLLELMRLNALDYTETFRGLTEYLAGGVSLCGVNSVLVSWLERWLARLAETEKPHAEVALAMRLQNPVVIPRNHHVERVIKQTVERGDTRAVEAFLSVLSTPYEEAALTAQFQDLPEDGDRTYQTFCGT